LYNYVSDTSFCNTEKIIYIASFPGTGDYKLQLIRAAIMYYASMGTTAGLLQAAIVVLNVTCSETVVMTSQ